MAMFFEQNCMGRALAAANSSEEGPFKKQSVSG